MQIINDTEVFEPNECFFCVSTDPENPGGTMVSITDKEYWNSDNFLNDGIGDHSFSRDLIRKMADDGITNAMEAIWTSESPLDEVRTQMLSYGFQESKEMYEAIDEWSEQ
jgi:hypothetical protein